jgi:hypothetical protein
LRSLPGTGRCCSRRGCSRTWLWGFRRQVVRELRLLASDAILAVVMVDVVVSGLLDWNRGVPLLLPLVPQPFDRWHLLASAVLVVYLVFYVSRRWRRQRRFTIREPCRTAVHGAQRITLAAEAQEGRAGQVVADAVPGP